MQRRYNRAMIKAKKLFMGMILFIALTVLGACIYKMYLDIDTGYNSNYTANVEVQRLSKEVGTTQQDTKSIADIIEEITPTVVGISKLKDSGNSIFLKDSVSKLGLGTGVVISENGYILTNQHVCGSKYSTCYVTLKNGKSFSGNVVWSDTDLDLAIVKITARGLQYINLGDSDNIRIADNVYAIGNPIGLEFQRTVTAGIVSGLNRTIKIDEDDKSSYMEDLIQTDATINPGNSGGPLINTNGEMIAINSVKITSAEGIGFAIPINIIKPVIEKFTQEGKFDEAYLGIFAYDKEVLLYLDEKLNLDEGIYVAQVSLDGPSGKSGLKIGDIIKKIDNREINTMSQLRNYIYQKNPGDTVELTIYRNGKESNISVELGRK